MKTGAAAFMFQLVRRGFFGYSIDVRYFEKKGGRIMKYKCSVCGWEYDEAKGYPDGGIAPGTSWSEVPDDFECPVCSVGKDEFEAE